MYAERFRYVYYLIAAVAAAAVCAVLIGPVALGDPVRVQTEYRDTPALSSSASAAEASKQFKGRPETIDGQQLGLPAGSTCDLFELADGIALICHQ